MLIPMVAGAAASYMVGTVLAYGVVAGAVAGGLVSMAASSAMGSSSAGSSTSEIFANQSRGTLINTASNVEPIPIVYGSRRRGGARVFADVWGDNNRYLSCVIVVSEGPISAINTVYLDDVDATDARFSALSLVTLEKNLGADDQSASQHLQSVLPVRWDSRYRLRGVANLVATLHFQESAFPGGLPVITMDVDGRTLYDPRTGLTAFSNNPALCIRDYLTSTRYGKGIPSSAIDDASFIVAANHCEESVSTPGGNQARYTCDVSLNPDDGLLSNLRVLLASCRGWLVFTGGQYKLVIDKQAAVSGVTFDEDNIVGGWSIQFGAKRTRYNRVKARFFNPARDWQPDFALYENTTHRTADNGLVLEAEIDLAATANLYRAQQIAMIEEKQSRFGIVARFRATIAGLRCDIGDVVSITHRTPGWTAKSFRVMRIALFNSDEVEVTVREYDDSVYTLDTLDTAPTTPSANLPNPLSVTAPSGLTLTSGTAELFIAGDGTIHSRIKAVWTLAADIFVTAGGRAEIQFKKTAGSPEQDWSPSLLFDGSLTQAFLAPVDDGDTYSVRIRFENRIGVRSSWTAGSIAVAGKTELPEDVTGFTAQQNANVVVFRWNQVADVDLAGYEIRFGAAGIAWADAIPLTQVTRGTQITTAAVPPGTWDTLIKAKDTSGNFSSAASRYSIAIANAFDVIQSAEQAPRWLGTRTNFIKHWTGVLIPDSTKLAKDHTKAELFEQFVPYPYATCTYEAPELGLAFDADVRTWADIDSVLGPGLTSGIADPQLQLDYRLGAGSYDGYENWAIGTVTGRYFKHRLALDTSRGKAVIRGFAPTLDAEERTETGTGITIGATGTAIAFATAFHGTPSVELINESATPLIPTRTAVSGAGFTGHLYNTSGVEVGGTAGYRATGA